MAIAEIPTNVHLVLRLTRDSEAHVYQRLGVLLFLRSSCGHGEKSRSAAGGTRAPFLRLQHQSWRPGAFPPAAPLESASVSDRLREKITHYTFWSLEFLMCVFFFRSVLQIWLLSTALSVRNMGLLTRTSGSVSGVHMLALSPPGSGER